ncbi:hypothetical protein [Botrimarina mediterranea]|uniref:hypothetical protein n=1 Tax=Botrimarina mediterranea TaxID=2528022 RepID=UPI0011AB0795
MVRSKTYLHYALVLLLSWPAPLPVVHTHLDYLSQPSSMRLLAEHVALHHESQEPSSVDPDEPHCHWFFVWAGLNAPMQAAPLDAEEGTVGRFAPADDLLPRTLVPLLAWFESDVVLDRGRMRLDSEYDADRPEPCGLTFHRLFCVWTC